MATKPEEYRLDLGKRSNFGEEGFFTSNTVYMRYCGMPNESTYSLLESKEVKMDTMKV